jgi:hypothetical protein
MSHPTIAYGITAVPEFTHDIREFCERVENAVGRPLHIVVRASHSSSVQPQPPSMQV